MPKLRPNDKQVDSMQKRLRYGLIDKGWSQQHLAELLGMSPAQVSRIFKAPDKCKVSTLLLIYRKLGIPEIEVIRQ